MRFATLHQDRLRSLAVCTSPVTFDAHHTESAEMIEREGVAAWVEHTITRRLDPQLVPPAYIRWYAAQMAATTAHVVSEFQRRAPGGDLRPLLASVQTPTLVLAAAHLREEVLGDFRGVADLFPNGRRVVFPGVRGFVQHILPVPCARTWLNFAASLAP
jgi:pimeloyl-ACP methyl ester carboxylesterase